MRSSTASAVARSASRGAADAQVRILLGTLGPRMTELACTVGDGALLTLTPPEAIPDLHGSASYVYMWVRACADADERTRREITSYATARPYARHFTALGYGAMVDQVQRLRSAGAAAGGPGRSSPRSCSTSCTSTSTTYGPGDARTPPSGRPRS